MNPQEGRTAVSAQPNAMRPPPPRTSDAGRDVEPSGRCTDDFLRWLGDRLEHDPAFQSRMETALRQIRVDRALADLRRAART